MAGKVKTWVWVLAAVIVIGILGIIVIAGAGLYFFSRHVETRVESPASASRGFDAVSGRFAGELPLIELDEHGRYLRSHTDRPARPGGPRPDSLRVMAFDPRDGRTVRVSLPFWILRMKAQGSIDFNGRQMQLDDLKLTVEDLEQFGPALVVDYRAPSGERVLVWTE